MRQRPLSRSPAIMTATASSSSARRKAGSRSARSRMVSRKSLVSATLFLLFGFFFFPFALFVFGPDIVRFRDIDRLPFLDATADQDDECLAVLAEVNAVAWPPVELVFRNAFAGRLDVREIALGDFLQGQRHLHGRHRVQTIEPSPEGAFPLLIRVFPDFDGLIKR